MCSKVKFLQAISFLICFLFSVNAYSQSRHYWSQQYGNKSTLLSGAVIGSVQDLGSTYYNPAFIGLLENPAFAIDAKVYQVSRLTVKDGFGEGKDLKQGTFGGAPSLVAGSFKVPFLKDHKFAYSYLTRKVSALNLNLVVHERTNAVKNAPGDELFTGEVNWNLAYKTDWFGISWAKAFHPKISVGVTGYTAVHSQSSLFDMQLEALTQANDVGIFKLRRRMAINTVGMLAKVGVAFDFSPLQMGITLTTPVVKLKGEGMFEYQDFLSGVDTDGDGIKDDVYRYDVQTGLEVNQNQPWALGAGASYRFKRGAIHFSGEWYAKVPEFIILETEDFISQFPADTISNKLTEALQHVVNFGIGLELDLNEKLSLYGSTSTNFSPLSGDEPTVGNFSSAIMKGGSKGNLFQIAGGANFFVNKIDVTLGVLYNWGKDEIQRPVNLIDEDDNPILESNKTSELFFRRFKIIFGFSIPLKNKDNEKKE